MGVLDVDTLVVEGWSSCVVVGVVLVAGPGGYFGELILAEIAMPGDLYRVVRQMRIQIQPPVEHVALVFTDRPRWARAKCLSWELIPPSRLLVADLIRSGSSTPSGWGR